MLLISLTHPPTILDTTDVSDRLSYVGSISGPITLKPPWAEPVAGARCLWVQQRIVVATRLEGSATVVLITVAF